MRRGAVEEISTKPLYTQRIPVATQRAKKEIERYELETVAQSASSFCILPISVNSYTGDKSDDKKKLRTFFIFLKPEPPMLLAGECGQTSPVALPGCSAQLI
jgi:hypothetical protein